MHPAMRGTQFEGFRQKVLKRTTKKVTQRAPVGVRCLEEPDRATLDGVEVGDRASSVFRHFSSTKECVSTRNVQEAGGAVNEILMRIARHSTFVCSWGARDFTQGAAQGVEAGLRTTREQKAMTMMFAVFCGRRRKKS